MNEKIINEEIEKVNRAMSQEGMPLTDEEKKSLKDIMIGKTTYHDKRKQIIEDTLKKSKGLENNGNVSKIR